jgi:hypothetical protein
MSGKNYWETIVNSLKKAGWSLGWVSAVDCQGRTIWIVDAHPDDGKRFIVRADEMPTAFMELQASIYVNSNSDRLCRRRCTWNYYLWRLVTFGFG